MHFPARITVTFGWMVGNISHFKCQLTVINSKQGSILQIPTQVRHVSIVQLNRDVTKKEEETGGGAGGGGRGTNVEGNGEGNHSKVGDRVDGKAKPKLPEAKREDPKEVPYWCAMVLNSLMLRKL